MNTADARREGVAVLRGILAGLVLALACWGVIAALCVLIVWLAETTVAHAVPFALAALVLLGVLAFALAWVRDRVLDARDRRRHRRQVLSQIRATDADPTWRRIRTTA